MKHILTDAIAYTHGLGEFESFKIIIDNTDGSATIKSSSKAMDILLSAEVKNKMPNFVIQGQEAHNSIGFLNLDVLNGYLKSPFFDTEKGATITPNYREDGIVTDIVFKSQEGHVCTYRTLSPEAAKRHIRTFRTTINEAPTFTFKPSEKFFNDFRGIESILGKFTNHFTFGTNNGMLEATIDGNDNKATIPVTACDATITNKFKFPIKQVSTIFRKAPSVDEVIVNIYNDSGMMEIIVNTEQAIYTYMLNAN